MTGFTTEQLIDKYIELRDRRDAKSDAIKKELAILNAGMDAIAANLLDEMNAAGETSRKTDRGTAFIKVVDFVGVGNWDTTLTSILTNQQYNLLNKAVNKMAVKEYIAEHGTPPPGVNYTEKREVQVRRA